MALSAAEIWTSQRAPLLWIAAPLVAGFWLAQTIAPTSPTPWILAGALLAGAGVGTALFTRQPTLPRLLLPFAFLFLATGWGAARLPVEPAGWRAYPAREARLDLRVTTLFAARGDGQKVGGIGVVANTDPHLAELLGQRVSFSLRLDEGPPPVRGDTLQTVGILQHLAASGEPPDPFDEHLRSQGVYLEVRGGRAHNTSGHSGPGHLLQAILDRMEGALREGSENHPAWADTVVAMLLGRSSSLPQDQKNAYLQTGTMHLFSISGLHIAVIAAALVFLAKGLRLKDRPAAILTLALLLVYVLATGARPSAIRAFLMVLCHQSAHLVGRKPAPFSALVAAALLTLVWEPSQLWDAGFQLSYAVVFAILLYGAPLAQECSLRIQLFPYLPRTDWRWPHKLAENSLRALASSVSISLAATVFSAPVSLALFELWAPGALLMNLLLIPLSTLVIIAGLVALPLGMAGFGSGAALFNHAAWAFAWLMDILARIGAGLPGMWMTPNEPVGGTEAALVTAALFASILVAPPGHRSGWFWWTPPLVLGLWLALR